MVYYNFESFDITQLVNEYKGKKLEELFPNQRIVKNEMGEFMELIWEIEDFACDLDLHVTKKNLLRNLKTVHYIGEINERRLTRRGVKTLYDLRPIKKYRNSVNEILTWIRKRDYNNLGKIKYIHDIDVSFCFELENLLFLDIETLGIFDSPVISIGVGFFKNGKYEIHIYFARDLEEEISICEHFRNEILPHFKCFVTYNGKTFDIPYIANRFLYFFEENPMISENETLPNKFNIKYHHIDLYHHCRRIFREKFQDFSLTTVEAKLLNWKRKNDLPSNMVGFCYREYKNNPERYIGLIKEIVEHNYYDVFSLPLIFKKLLENIT